jgi:excinuclease ABC subunit A
MNETKKYSEESILIHRARENNLKDASVSFPKRRFIVVTGPSGSGKSTLVFDVLHTEGQRRFLEGMSSYARTLLDIGAKPDVDRIEGLTPTIAVDQKSVGRNSRSTVGTLSEISDYLRVLFARLGVMHCTECKKPLELNTIHSIAKSIEKNYLGKRVTLCVPYVHTERKKRLSKESFMRILLEEHIARVLVAGREYAIRDVPDEVLEKEIYLCTESFVVDAKYRNRENIHNALESALRKGGGKVLLRSESGKEHIFYEGYFCESCKKMFQELRPQHFSFNHPEGACKSCSGLGEQFVLDPLRLITSEKLSIQEGAFGFLHRFFGKEGSRNQFRGRMEEFARKRKIHLFLPWGRLTKNQQQEILYSHKKYLSLYEGITSFFYSRYKESISENMQKEMERYMKKEVCSICNGKRLSKEALCVKLFGRTFDQWASLSLENMLEVWQKLQRKIDQKIPEYALVEEVLIRLHALCQVGVEYITLSRSTPTLSGGEAQRIRLAVQLSSHLSGVTYLLDEPSKGLHIRDSKRLLASLKDLQQKGNTVIVVEHDEDIIRNADYIVEVGPGSGREGGEICYQGTLSCLGEKTITGKYLSGKKRIAGSRFRVGSGQKIIVSGAKENNLKNITVSIPLGTLTVVSGVSGSGKTTFVHSILAKSLRNTLHRAHTIPGCHKKLTGSEYIDKVISITQSSIGQSSRSNVATYSGVFSLIRDVFSKTSQAQLRGYDASFFSFNRKGGRCEHCKGEGLQKVEMFLLPESFLPCEVCLGSRYQREILDIRYNKKTIADVLNMTVNEAWQFFYEYPHIVRILETLRRVGLGYLHLGQGAPHLSGGEAQRLKLASELSRASTGNTLYILDEPTVGLHFDDVRKLLSVLDALVDKGNSVLVVEHHSDVIRHADYIIDFGPGGGESGGRIVFQGSPRDIVKAKDSMTGKYIFS